jgi:hypothetical protein
MSRASLRRLDWLEREAAPSIGKVQLVFGHDPDEFDEKEAELMASAEWRNGDYHSVGLTR